MAFMHVLLVYWVGSIVLSNIVDFGPVLLVCLLWEGLAVLFRLFWFLTVRPDVSL